MSDNFGQDMPTALPVERPLSMAEKLAAEAAGQRADLDRAIGEALALPSRRSDTIGQLALALSKAQKVMQGASRDSKNPFFKSSYASLASVWDACREALSEQELAIMQPVTVRGRAVIVTTLLAHSSGEWIEERLVMVSADDKPQPIGSVITYARRYGLAAMVGVAPADDDGEGGTRTLPRGVKWDQAGTPLQGSSGSSDELPEDRREGPSGALQATQQTGAAQTSARPAQTLTGASEQPGKVVEAPNAGSAPVQSAGESTQATQSPAPSGTPAALRIGQTQLARPKGMGTSAPPPPGMKPPMKVPGSTTGGSDGR